mgnify:CR=1 FL=1|jgi:chaperonin GroES|tara:strand:- start:712 stop:978 length:267 start_codon:yes stop_codon:yes gene_type:complete
MKLKAIGVYFLIQPLEPEVKEGEIMVATEAKEEKDTGTVLSIGKGYEAKEVKVGDTVLYKKYAPDAFKHEGEEVYLVEEQDVMAVCQG